jgi:hypothetical protein
MLRTLSSYRHYPRLAWLIITGSRFDDWLYWHFFTITANYNSSDIKILLNDVWLTNDYEEESLTTLNESDSLMLQPTVSRPVSWNKAPIWGLRLDSYYCQTVAGLLMWSVLSDERTGPSFTISAGPRQCSHSRVHILLSHIRDLPFLRLLPLAGLRWR